MIETYKFTINGHPVSPIHSDDITDDTAIEQNQRYSLRSLVGTIKLIAADYDWLDHEQFNTKFYIEVTKLNSVTGIYEPYYSGLFSKTDCIWDIDDRSVQLKITSNDGYDKILGMIDKEVQLIDLLAEVERVNYKSRPIVQMYIFGKDTITNFSSSAWWEEDVTNKPEIIADMATFHFTLTSKMFDVSVVGSCTPDVTSGYASENHDQPAYSSENKYRFEYLAANDKIYIYDNITNVRLFEYSGLVGEDFSIPRVFTLNPVAGQAVGNPVATCNLYEVYSRGIMNVDTFNVEPTFPIPTIDIVATNRNYKRCIGLTHNMTKPTGNSSATPTEYGRNDFRKYFALPDTGSVYFPFAKSAWGNVAFWFDLDGVIHGFDAVGSSNEVLVDAYPIYSVISKMLSYFNTGLTFEDNTEYSEFLFNTINPISGVDNVAVLITQKTNIMINGYDKAAQKSPIMLKDIFDMLASVYQCYWHLEGTKLRIEHTYWYRNGRTYTGAPVVGLDLTYQVDPKNKLNFGFGQNKYTYDKSEIPQRIQFSWMDKVSKVFEGVPIEVINDYVAINVVKNIGVSKFTTDFDYALQNYKNVSSDGFAMLACSYINLFSKTAAGVAYGYKLDYTDGTLIADPNFNVSAWIVVDPAKSYIVSHKHSIVFAAGDPLGVSIYKGGIPESDPNTLIIPPAGCNMMRCTVAVSNWEAYSVTESSSKYNLPLIALVLNGLTYNVQNGYASWVYLQPIYYVYDAPARLLKINNLQVSATTITRSKVQTVVFPASGFNPSEQIKTLIGNGFVDKFSLNLYSEYAKATLKFEIE